MSFSSLPHELVHQVIESTVPHTFHSKTYRNRQRILCRLSLVSKLFRSIAQPLLLEIVKLGGPEDAAKLQETRAGRRDAGAHVFIQWTVIEDWDRLRRTKEETDRFAESLRVCATARNLTLSYLEQSMVASLLSMTSSHLTYLQLSKSYFMTTKAILLPSLLSLALHDVTLELLRSLLNSTTVPTLRNFALLDDSKQAARLFEEPSIKHFLLQLETLHLDSALWLKLDANFRQSVASRTLVDVETLEVETACDPESLVNHARLNGMDLDPILYPHIPRRLDDYILFLGNTSSLSLSLKSLFLDSSFQVSSVLFESMQSRINNLTQLCRERKIDLVFEQVPVYYELDPWISTEFIRRQKRSRDHDAGGDGVTR